MHRGITRGLPARGLLWAIAIGVIAGCGGGDGDAPLPQLAAATPATLSGTCEALAASLAGMANTTISATSTVAAGNLGKVDEVAGIEHLCLSRLFQAYVDCLFDPVAVAGGTYLGTGAAGEALFSPLLPDI